MAARLPALSGKVLRFPWSLAFTVDADVDHYFGLCFILSGPPNRFGENLQTNPHWVALTNGIGGCQHHPSVSAACWGDAQSQVVPPGPVPRRAAMTFPWVFRTKAPAVAAFVPERSWCRALAPDFGRCVGAGNPIMDGL